MTNNKIGIDTVYSELYEEGRYYRRHELIASTWYSIIILGFLTAILTIKSGDPNSGIYNLFQNNPYLELGLGIIVLIIGFGGVFSIWYSGRRYDEIRDFRLPDFPRELKQLLEEKCKKYGIDFRYYPRIPKTICLDPFIFCLITCDGKISPCCNIKTQGLNIEPFQFKGFWNSHALRAWRQKMLDRDYPPVCIKNCDIVGFEEIKA